MARFKYCRISGAWLAGRTKGKLVHQEMAALVGQGHRKSLVTHLAKIVL